MRLVPDKGNVSCTREDRYESICTYNCDEGYDLPPLYSRKTVCLSNGDSEIGKWSSDHDDYLCLGKLKFFPLMQNNGILNSTILAILFSCCNWQFYYVDTFACYIFLSLRPHIGRHLASWNNGERRDIDWKFFIIWSFTFYQSYTF